LRPHEIRETVSVLLPVFASFPHYAKVFHTMLAGIHTMLAGIHTMHQLA